MTVQSSEASCFPSLPLSKIIIKKTPHDGVKCRETGREFLSLHIENRAMTRWVASNGVFLFFSPFHASRWWNPCRTPWNWRWSELRLHQCEFYDGKRYTAYIISSVSVMARDLAFPRMFHGVELLGLCLDIFFLWTTLSHPDQHFSSHSAVFVKTIDHPDQKHATVAIQGTLFLWWLITSRLIR